MEKDAAERTSVQPRKGIGINVDLVTDLVTKILTSAQFVMVAAVTIRKLVPNRDEAAKSAWWNLYKDAILETDHGQLADRIRVAAEAIRARASLDEQVSSAERVEMQHAMAGLLILRRDSGQNLDNKSKHH
jgi:hypothetical protein